MTLCEISNNIDAYPQVRPSIDPQCSDFLMKKSGIYDKIFDQMTQTITSLTFQTILNATSKYLARVFFRHTMKGFRLILPVK